MSDTIMSKTCRRCKTDKPLSEFYTRRLKNNDPPTLPGHYTSECKDCMKERSHNTGNVPPTEPRAKTEVLAIEALRRAGHHALPGKAVSASDVDVVAWGAVWIEVKYARLRSGRFTFSTTPAQQSRNFLAHLVMLVCDYGNRQTYHLFPKDFEAFYMNDGRMKTGFCYTPGQRKQRKHKESRVKLLQGMMDAAQDRYDLIFREMLKISTELKGLPEIEKAA